MLRDFNQTTEKFFLLNAYRSRGLVHVACVFTAETIKVSLKSLFPKVRVYQMQLQCRGWLTVSLGTAIATTSPPLFLEALC